ncbi:hypothetical protein ACF0H5_016343 [Mactra antiquata]
MFGLIVHFTILSLAFANIDLNHDANVDMVQIKDELRRQGELTNMLLKLVQEQQVRLDKQENQIQQLSDRITEQDKTIAKQAEQIFILESRDVPEEYLPKRKDNNSSSETNTSMKYNVKRRASINGELRQPRMPSNSQKRAFQEGPVAFHATINAANDVTHINRGEKIVFDKVKFSIGGGYHSQHGLFIAPKAGIYIFSLSVMSSNHNSLEAVLQKNGVGLAGAFADSYNDGSPFQQGSVTVVTQLAVGDEVYVSNAWPDNTSLHTHDLTSFMGCLITEI